jgi:hypothetical protein
VVALYGVVPHQIAANETRATSNENVFAQQTLLKLPIARALYLTGFPVNGGDFGLELFKETVNRSPLRHCRWGSVSKNPSET